MSVVSVILHYVESQRTTNAPTEFISVERMIPHYDGRKWPIIASTEMNSVGGNAPVCVTCKTNDSILTKNLDLMFQQGFDSARHRPADLEPAGDFAESNVEMGRALFRPAFVPHSICSVTLDFLPAKHLHRPPIDRYQACRLQPQ